jgi:nucleotide-binding universal stress UspA family protein
VYHDILVPLDGSTFAEQALPHAVFLAKHAEARLHLVLVHEPMPTWVPSSAGESTVAAEARPVELAYLDGVVEKTQRQVPKGVESALLEAPTAGALAEYAVRQGFSAELLDRPVAAALATYAARQSINLIVLATHGRGPLTRSWFGGVADQVVRQVHMPVLFVRPVEGEATPKRPSYRHTLIPLDASPFSEAVLEHAMTLGSLSDARFTLLHVVEDTLPAPALTEFMPTEEFSSAAAAPWREQASRYLELCAARFRAEGRQVETATIFGVSPAAFILDEAHRRGVDLIALTTHGSKGLRRMLLGSVTDRIIRGSDIPVLAFRPPATTA